MNSYDERTAYFNALDAMSPGAPAVADRDTLTGVALALLIALFVAALFAL